MKKQRYRICITLKTTIPSLSNVYDRTKTTIPTKKGFRRRHFWLEKNDDTDGFLRFITEDFSTRDNSKISWPHESSLRGLFRRIRIMT